MAHKIDFSKGSAAFVSLATPAWHNLGTVIQGAVNTADALDKGGLNFTVLKLPNIHLLPNKKELISKESFFTCRTDVNKVLGSRLGTDYTVLQNIEALNIVDEILQSGTATIETAGAIDEGRKVFICLKINKDIVVGNADITKQYLLVCNSHDGTMSIRIMQTNVRVVCANTLAAALGEASNNIAVRHTGNAADRLRTAAQALKMITSNTQINTDNYNAMAANVISSAQMFDYFGNVFLNDAEIKALQAGKKANEILSKQKENTLKNVLQYANNGVGQSIAMKGNDFTMWAAYNAVTGFISRKKFDTADDRANSLLFGSAAKTIEMAGALALAPEKIQTLRRTNLSGLNLN